MMKRVIVNGDDFGLTAGTNAGILRSFVDGVLTSTTIMANGAAFEDAVEIANAHPGLGVGCHLGAVDGLPVSRPDDIPTLVDKLGRLPATTGKLALQIWRRKTAISDVERELRAQILKVMAAGLTPTHLDTHKHAHLIPGVLGAVARLATEFGIGRIRNPIERAAPFSPAGAAARNSKVYTKQWVSSAATRPVGRRFRKVAAEHGLAAPDRFVGIALTGLLDTEAMIRLLKTVGNETVEIMCHPGIPDGDLDRVRTRLRQSREMEMRALTDPLVRETARAQGVTFINYREL